MDAVPNCDLSSDHSPLIDTISTTIMLKQLTTKLHNKETDWEIYRNKIDEKIKLKKVKLPNEIDEALSNIHGHTQRSSSSSHSLPT